AGPDLRAGAHVHCIHGSGSIDRDNSADSLMVTRAGTHAGDCGVVGRAGRRVAVGCGARAVVRRWLAAAVLASLTMAMTPALSWSHPLHTTLADVSIDADGSLRVTLRAFADDFSAAVARHAGKPRPADYAVVDADVASYISATVAIQ